MNKYANKHTATVSKNYEELMNVLTKAGYSTDKAEDLIANVVSEVINADRLIQDLNTIQLNLELKKKQ